MPKIQLMVRATNMAVVGFMSTLAMSTPMSPYSGAGLMVRPSRLARGTAINVAASALAFRPAVKAAGS